MEKKLNMKMVNSSDGEYKEYYKSGLLREHSYYVNGEKISLNDYRKQIVLN